MADEWTQASVLELQRKGILLVEDGNHGENRPRPDEFVADGVAFIRAADMDNGQIRFHSASKINDRAHQRIRKGIGAPGDVLLSHKGTVGKVALVPHNAPRFVCSPQTTFWRTLDLGVLDRRYLHAFLRSPAFHQQLAARAGETDMAPYVSLTSQRELFVTLPPTGLQRAIGVILGALDDKIELNHRMKETLEAMARAIFKSWFVDFDPVHAKAAGQQPHGLKPEIAALFPDAFEDSELGAMPKGWRIAAIADIAEVFSGKRPTIRYQEPSEEANIPLWGGNGPMAFVPEPLVDYPILLTGRVGTLGSVFRIAEPCWPSDNTLILRSRSKQMFEYLLFQLRRIEFSSLNRGSTQPLLTQSDLRAQKLAVPSPEVVGLYHNIAHALLVRADFAQSESLSLSALRDALLPKLISGELRITDANQVVNRVAGGKDSHEAATRSE